MDAKVIDTIIAVLKPYEPRAIALFGSYSRGDHNATSDIDVAIKFKRGTTLFDICNMLSTFKDDLKMSVDIVDFDGIKPYFMKEIEPDLKFIYQA